MDDSHSFYFWFEANRSNSPILCFYSHFGDQQEYLGDVPCSSPMLSTQLYSLALDCV